MSADIEKLTVLDGRIVQTRPKFAVEKGALSLTNAPFNAIAATPSQHTYNIYVPSENVFVDRNLRWSSTVAMQFQVALAAPPAIGDSLVVPGRDFSLCSFPLNSLCSTLSATINDTTTVINSQDVMREVMRLTDYKKNRLQRCCPTMLDKYANYNDAFATQNNPIGGYDAATDYDNIPNGAFPYIQFTDTTGIPLGTAAPAFVGATYDSVNGMPTFNGNIGPHQMYIKWRSTESIILSPFVFADEHEWDTGLFGISNIQIICNLQSPTRLIRNCSRAGRTISGASIAFNTGNAQGVFEGSVVNVSFLTPSLDVPLPPKSVVPYFEFPRYITQYQNAPIAPGATGQIVSQTITLPQIPDLLIIYAKPSVALTPRDADYYFPLATANDNVRTPLSVNFDNFSGLLSSMSTEQLYAMSVHNGLDMDWQTFSGQCRSAGGSYGTYQQGNVVPLVGSVLVLKPSVDLTLQSGQAPSLVGNFTLQFNLTVKNTSAVSQQPQLYVITANSGFFESIRGSSRIIKGVLSEQDIINAPLAGPVVRTELDRIVGGLSFKSFGNMLSKARDVYSATKPLVSAAKSLLPSSGALGTVKSGLEAVGYGTGGSSGGGTGGRKKKSLAARLM